MSSRICFCASILLFVAVSWSNCCVSSCSFDCLCLRSNPTRLLDTNKCEFLCNSRSTFDYPTKTACMSVASVAPKQSQRPPRRRHSCSTSTTALASGNSSRGYSAARFACAGPICIDADMLGSSSATERLDSQPAPARAAQPRCEELHGVSARTAGHTNATNIWSHLSPAAEGFWT